MKPDDYYQILGVPKTATREEIQKAYRQLARKYHPDLNQNNPKGTREKFQKVQEAFDILGNPEKRKVYDQFGVSPDQMGSGGGQGPFQWSFGGGAPGGQFRKGNFNFENIEDLMKMFGGGFGGAAPDEFVNAGRRSVKGRDIEQSITIPFTLSITGGKIDIRHPDGQTVSVTIPSGFADGKKIRVQGLGEAGQNGGNAGNLILLVHVDAHPFYHRQGGSLYVELPISLKEAVFGTKIDVPTPKGNVTLTVPAGAASGMKLRIKQCGIPDKTGKTGDLFAKLMVVLPKNWSDADKRILGQLQTEPEEPIRGKLRWE
jgi:DnaJ-class molecular chaperone